MSDFFQEIVPFIEHYAMLIVAVLSVFIIFCYLSRKKLKAKWLNLKTRFTLNRLGFEQIKNFQCPDGLGHYYNIDRLILCRDGISLLLYKRYPGMIFCADKIDDWTQMTEKKSYRFKNPLYDLEHQIKAVSICVAGVPVNGFLFFDYLAAFPKGHPDRIFQLDNVPVELKSCKHDEVDASVMTAWKNISLMAKA